VLLVAAAVVLTAALWTLTDAAVANQDTPSTHRFYVAMASLATLLLIVVLVFLALYGVRWMSQRFKTQNVAKPTEYVNAWAEAGKRFELPPEDAEGSDDQSPED